MQKTTRADLDLAVQRYRITCEHAEGVKRGQESDRIDQQHLSRLRLSNARDKVELLALDYLLSLCEKAGISAGFKVAA